MTQGDITTRVLQVNVDDKNNGGVFSLIKNVYHHMPEDVVFDFWAVEPIRSDEFRSYVEQRGGAVYCLFKKNKYTRLVSNYRALKRHVESIDYDAVHVHSDKCAQLLIYARAARNATGKVIIHSHQMGVDLPSHRKLFTFVQKASKLLITHTRIDCYAACSRNAAEWMYPKKILGDVRLINNGIEVENFKFSPEDRARIRAKHGIGDEFLVGHVGRFTYAKNHDFVVSMFAQLKDAYPDAKFLLIGDGSPQIRAHVERLVDEKGLTESVIYVRSTSEMSAYMSAMDAFVLPSIIEGYPVTMVEAQSNGLPCVISTCVPPEGKLIDAFWRLPIDAVGPWVAKVGALMAKGPVGERARSSCWKQVSDAGYGIEHTVGQLLELYRS